MELESEIAQLPAVDLQALLCTACSVRQKVAAAHPRRSQELDRLLKTRCDFYIASQDVCAVSRFYEIKE